MEDGKAAVEGKAAVVLQRGLTGLAARKAARKQAHRHDDGSGSHAHGLRDPVDSFGELVDSCTAGDSTVLRQGLHRMHVHLCTLWLSCQMGPFALSRLLRYGAHGKELNRRFAAALGGRDDQPAPMWRIDHVFVRPEWRGRGICRRLINIACVGADTAGDERLEPRRGFGSTMAVVE